MSALKICPQCGTEYELDQRFCPKDGSTLKMQGAATDLIGSIINKSYHVLRKLGEGGMGTVYLAEHVKMGRKSAVKVMNPGTVNDADAISRFNREAANASKISHPNVAAVYDFGETEDGMIFLAMEFVEGPALTNVVKELGALSPARAGDITRQVAEALSVAHDMGIVHRDLKPDNIMLAKNRDGTDCVKVVDFGIAKAANNEAQKVTKTGLVVGTPEYMSPEQLAGDKLDGRSDTYSLALVAFNMLTGKLPFPAETVQESMIMRLTDRPRKLLEMKPDVVWPTHVQAVLDKALERDATARYQTASEFGRELFKALSTMRASSATRVMSPGSLPPTAVPPELAHGAPTRPIPATRVSVATPPGSLPAIPPERRSKTPMIATFAAVAVLAVGGGGYFLFTKNNNADARSTALPRGDSTPVNSTGVTRPVTLADSFEEIEKLNDLNRGATVETAGLALAKLDSIAPIAQSDSDRVRIDLLRAESHFALLYYAKTRADSARELKVGCDILKEHEGKARDSRFKARYNLWLYGDTQKGFPKTC